jgi:hypothetical protein
LKANIYIAKQDEQLYAWFENYCKQRNMSVAKAFRNFMANTCTQVQSGTPMLPDVMKFDAVRTVRKMIKESADNYEFNSILTAIIFRTKEQVAHPDVEPEYRTIIKLMPWEEEETLANPETRKPITEWASVCLDMFDSIIGETVKMNKENKWKLASEEGFKVNVCGPVPDGVTEEELRKAEAKFPVW